MGILFLGKPGLYYQEEADVAETSLIHIVTHSINVDNNHSIKYIS